MLQPEGHGGPWFETEPSEPWERFVWRSQRYVGDPVSLRPLTGEKASAAFKGQPDICGEEVVERMGEMGFENVEGSIWETMHTCEYEVQVNPQFETPAVVSAVLVNDVAESVEVTNTDEYGPGSSEVLRSFSNSDDLMSCVAQIDEFEEDSTLLITVDSSFHSEGTGETCRQAFSMYWVFKNLGIIKGNHDQVRPGVDD